MKTGFLLFFIVLSSSFMIAYVNIFTKFTGVSKAFVDLYISHTALQDFIEKHKLVNQQSAEQVHNENFIKFLSDSRDWAFEYIEESQETVQEVIDYLENKGTDFDKQYAKKLKKLLTEESSI